MNPVDNFVQEEVNSIEKANKVDPPAKKGALEQESIYTLLCNFVLGSEDLIHGLSISELNQAAYELKTYLKTQNDLEQVDRRNLGEQLDFLLEKIDYLKYCLHTNFDPPEVEFDNFPDPFMIQSKHRWQLYKHWVEIYKDKLRGNLEKLCNHHERLYANYNDLKEMHNVKLLREMDVVGMTTTCAARLRSTIEALKSPIVIVEEAAEVLESHIVTALTKDCQQLILLGDHQQLRPATSDYTIEKKYKLGISLFERMVQNDVECHTLNVQHRMRPEISSLITPLFYKELFNHQSVKEYPLVSGIDLPLYFIDHIEPEEPYGDSSKMNTHEAKFLIQLAIYLLNNNYKAEDITILAAYLGQSYELKKEKDRSLHPNIGEVKIAVVDNFQGEENQIILLSLVRSNSENKVGFLSIDNRVCVALSRAKVGFYIMGNMTQLCEATDIWKSIRTSLESQKAIGRYLPLRCKNHKEHTTLVSKATDFLKVPEGGCNQACNATLECGHTCVKICHGNDVNHELYNCKEPCTRSLCYNEDHKCKKQCFEKCGGCHYLVNRKLPCGHEKNLACSTTVDFYECVEPVEMKPDCGHLQNIPCSLKTKIYKEQENSEIDSGQELNTDVVSFKCKVEIEKVISKCGHTQMVPCFEVGTFKCLFQIEITLKCGHKKEKLCYLEEEKVTCLVVCGKILGCGHKCMRKCHDDDPYHKRYKCTEPCTKNLSGCNNPEAHQKCQLICFQSCLPCKKPVMKSYISCSHIEKIECHKATETRGCHRPCSKKLACGHLCKNKCFELCSSCQQTTFKMIPECGHKIKVKCTEVPLQRYCKKQCSKTLECGHSCTRCCNESCNTVCNQQCQKKLDCGHRCIKRCHEDCACKIEVIPMCGHSITIKCGDELSSEKCKRSRNKRLDCGHTHFVPCNKPISSVICDEKSPRILACGHTQLGECSKSTADIKCYHSCEKLLECGHKCNKLCCEPCNKECQQRCNKKLECGHPCQARCSQPCTPLSKCLMPCEKLLKCNHKCDKRCYQPCTKICAETCDKKLHCGHTCSNTCGDECNVVCETRCGKKLDCGHHCHEFCGKPCVKVCRRSCKKTLQCGHRCNKKCFEACDTVCGAACGKLLRCGHACKQLCGQPCTQTCGRFCGKTLECGHLCKEKCGDLCTPLSQCKNPCEKTLSCGHDICTNLCNEPCTECFNKCIKKLDCGHMCINKCYEKCACSIVKSGDCAHYVRIKCGEIPTKLNCMQPCNKLLSCDHHCKQQCNEDCKCLESCRQRLKCGCMCIKFTCSEPCECRNGCFINENEE